MTIHEYGDRNKPHILLIHVMEKFREDYHIIAPDLTGHGDDQGSFPGRRRMPWR